MATQILARYTTYLDGRKSVKMTGRVYLRAIVPIGVFFSLSLICSNLTYLYLSVAFIQMLKATTPVAVLLAGWALGVSSPNLKTFLNVSAIVIGVIIASIGEIKFDIIGFMYQMAGVAFEAIRLTMVQRLLSGSEFKMDPLVSLYYFAPVCAAINLVVAIFWELPKVSMVDVYNVGLFTFLLNGMVAFGLNVSVVMLVSLLKSSLIFQQRYQANKIRTDRQDLLACPHALRSLEGCASRCRFDAYLGHSGQRSAVLRLQHCLDWYALLQARSRPAQGLCR